MSFTPFETLAADDLGEGPSSWTPVLGASTTNPDLGDGATATGYYYRVLKRLIVFDARIIFGTTSSAGSGLYELDLPTAADDSLMNATGGVSFFTAVGHGSITDNSAGVGPGSYKVIAGLYTGDGGSSGRGQVRLFHMDGTNSTVQDDTPFIWADGDRLTVSGFYLLPG